MSPETLKSLLPRLAAPRVLIVGDVVLDEYLIGRATRLSREAAVPVLEFEARRLIPGGAANPAANIAALGASAAMVGVIGEDDAGVSLRALLHARGIGTQGLLSDRTRPTTVKTRVMAQMGLRFPQQVARLDRLARDPLSAESEQRVIAGLRAQIPQADAVLLSDYRLGLLTPALVTAIRGLASAAGVRLTADAQGELDKYSGAALIKCNADEAAAYLGEALRTDADFAAAARALRQRLQLSGAMMITRGADGATLALADGAVLHSPAPDVTDVFDTVGAGDTSVAVMTLALAAGLPYAAGVQLANTASGLVVRRVGNYTPSLAELAAALDEP